MVTYTLSQLEGTVENLVTYSFDNPTQTPYEYGYLADDVRHKARVTLSYDFPYGFQVGGTAIYQSGRPESKYFLNNFYGGYSDRRAPRGYDPKDVDDPTDDVELRLPDFFYTNVLAHRRRGQPAQHAPAARHRVAQHHRPERAHAVRRSARPRRPDQHLAGRALPVLSPRR